MGFTDRIFFDTIVPMQYAIIETGGKQYKITKGQTFDFDSLGLNAGDAVTFDKVLLHVTDGAVEIGMPYVAGAVVSGKVVDNLQGEKVRAARFQAKSRHRRVTGFRAQLTRVEISDIKVSSSKQKETKKAKSE
jgi:large subunit ribosomal protein L21